MSNDPSRTTAPRGPVASEPPWQALREAYFLLRERWGENLGRFGLSFTDYTVLDLCAQGPAKASAVARATGVTAAGATDVIDRLVARRLVRRVADPGDRRVVLIRLTPAGRRLHRDAGSTKRATVRYLKDALSPPEQRALSAGLAALTRVLRSGRGASDPGGA